jgi:hypothetical protein
MFQYDNYIYDLPNEQMATVRIKNDMTALLQFLESDDYTKGHPKETELIAAINDINNNIRVKQAFEVLKTALSEEGWLMAVLTEHMNEAAFERAYKVCVCIYASIRFATGDSAVSHDPGNEWQFVDGKYPNEYYRSVCGTWQYVDDIYLDDEYNEIMEYRHFRNCLQSYVTYLLNQWAFENRQALTACQSEVDKLNYWLDTIPGRYDLVHCFRHPTLQQLAWCYNTSYLTFSSTNRLTRSWMVANLPTVVLELKKYKTTFTSQLPEDERERHESICNDLMDAYEAWRTLAEPRVKVPFQYTKQRELGVHKTNMQGMLEELRLCNV